MRRDWREISGNADGVIWADNCQSAQPKRARADLLGREFLELLEGGFGAYIRDGFLELFDRYVGETPLVRYLRIKDLADDFSPGL